MSARGEQGPMRSEAGCVFASVVLQGETEMTLIIHNSCGYELRVSRVVLEYSISGLAYDRRESSQAERRVVEVINLGVLLEPGAEARIRLRNVNTLERICVEYDNKRECVTSS